MSNRNVRIASAFAPNWSADALANAVPRSLPPLHAFEFVVPANATTIHRPRRDDIRYIARTEPRLFRVR